MTRNVLAACATMLLMALSTMGNAQNITYVTQDGAGLMDGSSWENAYKGTSITSAINALQSLNEGGELWLASGTYTILPINPAKSELTTIKIYGGFRGSEKTLGEREKTDSDQNGQIQCWEYSATTMVDLTNNDDNLSATSSIDGVTFSNLVVLNNVNVSKSVFKTGFSTGICTIDSSYITGTCSFNGGGLIKNSEITKASTGISMSYGGEAINCKVYNNSSSGVEIYNGGTLSNCLITNNNYGIYVVYSGIIVNSTICNNNTALSLYAGGKFTNCILWGNSTQSEISSYNGVRFENCAVQDIDDVNYFTSCTILDNSNSSTKGPQFKNPTSFSGSSSGNSSLISSSNWNITSSSPCFNGGTMNNTTTQKITVDLDGKDRVRYGKIDIGAYENQTTFYISESGSGSLSGDSWENSLPGDSIQYAISSLSESKYGEIWVKSGVYYPVYDTSCSKNANEAEYAFVIKKNVKIFGGFKGVEKRVSERERMDYDYNGVEAFEFSYPTIFDGRNASYHVLYNENGCDNSSVVDGVTIMNGNAQKTDPAWSRTQAGGGVYMEGGVYENCVFSNNYSGDDGGGVHIGGGLIKNSLFTNNFAQSGGAITIAMAGQIDSCVIRDNNSELKAGGVFIWRGGLITNSKISNNYTSTHGGGIFIDGDISVLDAGHIVNCLISNNTAEEKGGGLYADEGGTLIGCIIDDNESGYMEGCGVYLKYNGNIFNCLITKNGENGLFLKAGGNIKNSIITNNNSNIYADSPDFSIENSICEGIMGALQIPFEDIQFENYLSDGFNLKATSPCVNTGGTISDSLFPSFDINGVMRSLYGRLDIGPFEKGIDVPSSVSNGSTIQNINEKPVIRWTNSGADGYVVFIKEGTTGAVNLVNGLDYKADATFTKGDNVNDWYCVYNGTGDSVAVDGLYNGLNYRVMVIPFNGKNYKVYNNEKTSFSPATFLIKQSQSIYVNIPDTISGIQEFYFDAYATSNLRITITTDSDDKAFSAGNTMYIQDTGKVVLTFSQQGNNEYFKAPDIVDTITIVKAKQHIESFEKINDVVFNQTNDIPLSAKATSNLLVKFISTDNTIAIVSGDNLIIKNSGTVSIKAYQPGNKYFSPSDTVTRIFTVKKATQGIKLSTPHLIDTIYSPTYIPIIASSNVGLSLTYTNKHPEICNAANGIISILGAGKDTITISTVDNNNYNAFDTTILLNVRKANQHILINDDLDTIVIDYGSNEAQLDVASTSSLPVSYKSKDYSVAYVINNIIKITGCGETEISLNCKGNDNFNDATEKKIVLIVDKADQSIIVPQNINLSTGESGIAVDVFSTSSLKVYLQSLNNNIASVDKNNYLKGISPGITTIRATQPGNKNYLAAESRDFNVVVCPEITITRDTTIDIFELLNNTCTNIDIKENGNIKVDYDGTRILLSLKDYCTYSIDTLFAVAKTSATSADIPFFVIVKHLQMAEQLAFVTVDKINAKSNLIVWLKTKNAGIKEYVIERGGEITGVYKTLGTVNYNNLSVFEDSVNVDVTRQAYSYRLRTVDQCGNKSEPSPEHKTMLLQIGQGTNNDILLGWSKYEGTEVANYIIYRYNNQTKVLDSIGSTAFEAFNDYPPTGASLTYRVGINLGRIVDPRQTKSDNGPYSYSLSNMAESELLDGSIVNEEDQGVYPNPASDKFTVDCAAGSIIMVANSLGQEMLTISATSQHETIDCSGWARGVYAVKVLSAERYYSFKITVK